MKAKDILYPRKDLEYLIFAFFAWFIFAFLIFPNLNTIVSVFFQDGQFTTVPFDKLIHSAGNEEPAQQPDPGSALSITVAFVGISLVLITEYFDIKGADPAAWLT